MKLTGEFCRSFERFAGVDTILLLDLEMSLTFARSHSPYLWNSDDTIVRVKQKVSKRHIIRECFIKYMLRFFFQYRHMVDSINFVE